MQVPSGRMVTMLLRGQIHSFKGEVEVPSGAACTILLQPNHPRNVANVQMQPKVADKGVSCYLKKFAVD